MYDESINVIASAESKSVFVPIKVTNVLYAESSSFKAAAISFKVSSVPGAPSIKLLICVVTKAESAKFAFVYVV